VHIFRHLLICFQTSVYTLGELHQNRNNSTVFEELSVSISSPVKRHLRPSNPQLTPPTLQMQYYYSLIAILHIHVTIKKNKKLKGYAFRPHFISYHGNLHIHTVIV
jgi:hypothetical protein